jgi:hypothetical protein
MERRTLQARRRQPIRWLKSGPGGALLCVVSIGSTFAVYIYLEIRQSINWRNTSPNLPDFLRIGDVGWGYMLHASLQTIFPCGDTLLSRTADIYRFSRASTWCQCSESHSLPGDATWNLEAWQFQGGAMFQKLQLLC